MPEGIDEMLQKTSNFKLDGETSHRPIKDNHLLVLIPATVDGDPFTLNKLGKLLKTKFPDNDSGYRRYLTSSKNTAGNKKLPHTPYWVLMTRDVLAGSRGKKYSAQAKIVDRHASAGYRLPYALEVSTSILMYYACHDGERLFADSSWTYTRCLEVNKYGYPIIFWGFSSVGLVVAYDELSIHGHSSYGVSCCRKL